MTRRIIAYLALLYAMYFLGHVGMSMAYGMGPSATTAMGVGLATATVVSLWMASGGSEGKREMVWGIVAGFFLWCFFGEFLEHERIIALAEGQATALLVPSVTMISYAVYKKLLPVGMRFSLGHFGCVWLLHAILVHQMAVIKPLYPELFTILLPGTGLAFLLISLLMLFKTVTAGSEKAFMAHLLLCFIYFWGTMETLQAMNFLPDYTCYAYWEKGSSCGSGAGPLKDEVDSKIALIRKRYRWNDQEAEKRAYSLLKRIPSPGFIEDFGVSLEQQMKGKGGQEMDGELFYGVMEESFVKAAASAFDRLLKTEIEQFKTAPAREEHQCTDQASYPNWHFPREAVREKIAFIKEHYPWETAQTRELAGYLLNRFSLQFLTGDEFIKQLDEKRVQGKAGTLSEELLCRVMQEHFTATSRTVFQNLVKINVQESQYAK